MLTQLQSQLVWCICACNLATIVPVLTGQHYSLLAAELIALAYIGLGTLVNILMSASSVLKLLIVTNFNFVFSRDPEQLARHALVICLVLALGPNVVFILWTVHGQCGCSNSLACFLMGRSSIGVLEMTFIRAYFAIWMAVSLMLAVAVIFGTPFFIQRMDANPAIRNGEYTNNVCTSNVKTVYNILIYSGFECV